MQITLKQTEIVEALKQFIVKQGLSLQGKQVDVTFTAGRGDTGLTAGVSIDDADIPGVDSLPSEPAAPLALVPPAKAPEAAAAGTSPATAVQQLATGDDAIKVDTAVIAGAAAAKPAGGTSLFS